MIPPQNPTLAELSAKIRHVYPIFVLQLLAIYAIFDALQRMRTDLRKTEGGN